MKFLLFIQPQVCIQQFQLRYLLNIPITLPEVSIRRQITEKVRASRKAREQSKQLLEIAKIGVERASATDEATTTAWMKQQLEALEVDLG